MGHRKTLVILPGSAVTEVQEDFSGHYPFLAIECFETSDAHSIRDESAEVQDASWPRRALSVDIGNDRTVAEVLHDLRTALCLNVRMSRKSGKVWNVISLTDNWTLGRQNTAGAYVSELMSMPGPDGDEAPK